MAKIIVDIDKEGQYQFFIRRDTNRTVASSSFTGTKGECKDAIALFQEYASHGFYWTYKRSKVANYHYADWEKNGIVVTTKYYTNLADLNKAITLIKSEISFKTPILHTTIKNDNYV